MEFNFSQSQNSDTNSDTSALDHRIKGEVMRMVFRSDDGNYAVLKVRTPQLLEVVLVGPLAMVAEGQDIEAVGRWETHKEHGRQLRVTSFEVVLPVTKQGITKYLQSSQIPGLGKKTAERIVKHFGTEALHILDNFSERLAEVNGIGKRKAKEIKIAWGKLDDSRNQLIFLQGLSLSASLSQKVIEHYQEAASQVVRKNPYQLYNDINGIGFIVADQVAMNLGISQNSLLRMSAGVAYVLKNIGNQGHVCVPKKFLINEAMKVLGADAEATTDGLRRAIIDGRVVADDSFVDIGDTVLYHRAIYEAEVTLAERLHLLIEHGQARFSQDKQWQPSGIETFNAEQKQAVQTAFNNHLSIITGGPGVGKTTVVGAIVKNILAAKATVSLAAPTGRAAKRLSESTKMAAKTVHRLLQWNAKEGNFIHNEDNPIKQDFIIIDEVSMLDTELAEHLFAAISAECHVILVGDKDQLPSVGAGAVLHDLIICNRIPVTQLVTVYRQEEGSRIVTNAHFVNHGKLPDLTRTTAESADFYWIEQNDPEKVNELIIKMAVERIPQKFGFKPQTDIQILVPMRKGICGQNTINELLQNRINPPGKPEFKFGESRYRHGDRVMQIKNNYDKSVFNGEMGIIKNIDRTQKNFSIQFEDQYVTYNWDDAKQIRLAYAITVHKSQGSEFPVVIMPVLNQHFIMLQRNLLYTGMTRARKLLILIGTRKALSIAIHNNRPMQRWTGLARRLIR